MNAISPFGGGPAAPMRAPPVFFEAEMAVLAAVLADNRAYDAVSETLKPEHFADERHGRIYRAAAGLIERGLAATPVTLKRTFEQDGQLAELGGAEYLARLVAAVPSIRAAPQFAAAVVDCWQRRALIAALDRARAEAYEPPVEDLAQGPGGGEAAIERLGRALAEIAAGADSGGPQPIAAAIRRAIDAADRAAKAGGEVTGVTTGLTDLDAALGGLHAPDLVVLAGRPSMGKSALAQTIARNAARAGHGVLFFSLEMGADQLGQRELSSATGISTDRQRQGKVSVEQFGRLLEAQREMAGLKLYVDDTPMLTPQRMRARALRVKRQHGLGLIVVDYLQLMSAGGRAAENRTQEVTQISAALKGLAKALAVPVLALSQLSRKLEERDDKRPVLSDLRESGAIEQDADVVAMVYRHEYYIARHEPQRRSNEDEEKFAKRNARWIEEKEKWRGIAEVLVEKNRQGPTAAVKLYYDAVKTTFENLARPDDDRE